MALSCPGRGRGRARISTVSVNEDFRPSTDALSSSPDPTTNPIKSSNTSQPVSCMGRGRGRGIQRKKNEGIITNLNDNNTTLTLSVDTLQLTDRPSKLSDKGTIGNEIRIMVNYFPVVQYPKDGLVYQYYIEIRNKCGTKINRQRRRALYETWLHKLCREYPNIDRSSIIFDNGTTIFVFDELLPNINENAVIEMVNGMNQFNRMEKFKFIIKRVGDPIDFSLLRSPDVFLKAHNDLIRIQKVLSIALHEHCSSHARFVYNRSFYSQPTLENRYGRWDLRMGKALWRGFYSCLVFANGKNKLLISGEIESFLGKVTFGPPCIMQCINHRVYLGMESKYSINPLIDWLLFAP